MITKTFGQDFFSSGGALTLNPYEVCGDNDRPGFSSFTHKDGWTISGVVVEDYFLWVNDFEATHPIYGRVWGDFEEKVYADSEEGFDHFYQNHTPCAWDYWDI